ncbi:MAG TPA: hypothetical protein VGB64_15295 [Actinomycetota bacterium]
MISPIFGGRSVFGHSDAGGSTTSVSAVPAGATVDASSVTSAPTKAGRALMIPP